MLQIPVFNFVFRSPSPAVSSPVDIGPGPCGTPVPPFTEPRDGLVGEAATAGLGSLRFNLEGDSA